MDATFITWLLSLWKKSHNLSVVSQMATPLSAPRLPGFALEPRIMLDAALAGTASELLSDGDSQPGQVHSGPQPENSELAQALNAMNPSATSHDVILVDPSVPDYETLLAEMPETARVHVLSGAASLEEIAGVLSGYQNLNAVHIISHGSSGSLSLSGETVNSELLKSNQDALAVIGQSLNEDGDILLYGCNVGSGEEGAAFIKGLAEMTGADIAASDDLTGSATLDGDWELEVSVGSVLSAMVITDKILSNYGSVLNNAPTVEGAGYENTVREDTASDFDMSPVSFEDVDGDSLTVTLTASAGTLTASSGGGVTIGGSGTGTLTLSGIDSNINTYLDTVSNIQYTSVLNASGNGVANVVISATDGTDGLISNPTIDIDVTPVNDAPTVTGLPADITVTEDTGSDLDLSTLSFDDIEGDTLTVTLTGSTGTMTASSGGGVTMGGSGTGTLTLNGTASNINAYLDTTSNIQYTSALNASGDNAATLTVSATDGTDAMSDQVINIDITPQNDAPTVANIPSDIFVLEDIASDLDLSMMAFDDVDGDSLTVTLSLSSGTLAASTGGGVAIAGSGTATLTLSGTATDINTYLDTTSNIRYTSALNANGDNAATLTISATDGTANLGYNPTVNIDIGAVNDAPVVNTGNNGVTFIENNSNVPVPVIDASATITDEDSANLLKMVISIANGKTDDLISLDGRNDGDSVNGITITYNSGTLITLAGTASKASYLALLKELQFVNSSHNPDTTTRTVAIAATDTENTTGNANTSIVVQPTDDAAVVTGVHTGVVTEGNAGDISTVSGALGITDVDDSPTFADQASTPGDNDYGSFVLNRGIWTYTLNQAKVQGLGSDDTVTDTITYTASDGTQQVVSVEILGSDEPVTETVIVRQPPDPVPIVTRDATEPAQELVISDPLNNRDGAILNAVVLGEAVEPAVGNASDSIKSDSGLISSGTASTSAFSMQGLFNQQGAMDARYGVSLVTGSQTPLPAASDNSATVSSIADSPQVSAFDAELNEVLIEESLQEQQNLFDDKELNGQPGDEATPEDDSSASPESDGNSQTGAGTEPAGFSVNLAMVVDSRHIEMKQLQDALKKLNNEQL